MIHLYILYYYFYFNNDNKMKELGVVCFAQYQGSSACLGTKSRHGQTRKF